jgi:hypothetical protein
VWGFGKMKAMEVVNLNDRFRAQFLNVMAHSWARKAIGQNIKNFLVAKVEG